MIPFGFLTCRFVHVSSAGVTRPDRPGLDLSKQPPAVRLNKELGFILTFKLKVKSLLTNPLILVYLSWLTRPTSSTVFASVTLFEDEKKQAQMTVL